ncbi:hypothetical protein DPMN_165536 [Dreissena polymorpha]|uniref:Uncharacterized protein n=1 Tax=Dreissena polymorpha TaxID=45954 RepID=A0A9D4F0U0_DREPO|nr:hypothetical protein DPMN_165536 [Dreissena polymorpha]
MTCIISILPSIIASSFMKKYEELTKLSQDPEECDRLTDRRTQSENQKSPPVKPVGDNNTVLGKGRKERISFSLRHMNRDF